MLSKSEVKVLAEFLDGAERPDGTFTLQELQGFLFAVACSWAMIGWQRRTTSRLRRWPGNRKSLSFRLGASIQSSTGLRVRAVTSTRTGRQVLLATYALQTHAN